MMIERLKNKLIGSLHSPRNILESGIRMPETIYIVAGGPNGVPHYRRIPNDAYILAVNQSVLIPDIHPDLWVINSVNKFVLTWLGEATRVFAGIRVFKESCIEKTPKRFRKKEFFFYRPTRNIESKTAKIGPDTLYAGGTVSGFAIQIAEQLGAKEIILCGVDMSGQLYWNGISRNRPTHGETWDYAKRLDLIIQHFREERQLNIYSLSPTKLHIPVN